MISESEREIGNCERLFDLARNKLEKIVIAIEEDEALHGAPSQKLLYDLASATADFSAAIEELNAAYALRDSKQPPRRVPPAENYLELFRKNAAAKREGRDAARREEAEAAAKETYDAALRASTRPIAPVAPRRFELEPPPRPANTSLQDVIDEIESRINRMTAEISALEKPGEYSGILGLKRAREKKEIKASERARLDLLLADLLPPYEKKLAEREQLRKQQRNLMAQRGDAKKAVGKS
jgi:hypothetical protein